jgi:hypothetical protein
MKIKFSNLTGILLAGLITFSVIVPTPVHAQTKEWSGVCVGNTAESSSVATIQGLECLLANSLMVFITLIGLVGFLMLIVASFRYLLSGGNAKGTEAARNSITYAIIGLVVALCSFFIINIIASFTGISLLTNFSIPTSDTVWQ